jgi:hypothetical protein
MTDFEPEIELDDMTTKRWIVIRQRVGEWDGEIRSGMR